MRSYWSETTPSGRPVPEGQVLRILDYSDDGMGMVAVYGKDVDEVLAKIEKTNFHAQKMVAEVKPRSAATPPAAPPAAPSVRMTNDQRMQATADLENPAKASTAVVKLFEDASGIRVGDLQQERFNRLFQGWLAAHSEFPRNPINLRLLLHEAASKAGGRDNITAQTFDSAHAELANGGLLLAEMPVEEPLDTLNLEPQGQGSGESREPAPPRPRTVSATTHRSTRLSSQAGAVPFKPKYTREQIDGLSIEDTKRLVNDPEYNASIDHWYPSEGSRRRA